MKEIISRRNYRILGIAQSNNIFEALYGDAKTSGIAQEFIVIPEFNVLPTERYS